ncbi:hypothetical protein GW17_00033480 [Ensete ventricosum]|nr:hypothetical protein GW17_00033480 [Ensete ventricosum]
MSLRRRLCAATITACAVIVCGRAHGHRLCTAAAHTWIPQWCCRSRLAVRSQTLCAAATMQCIVVGLLFARSRCA